MAEGKRDDVHEEDSFDEEFGGDRRKMARDLEAGYGRRKADHPIRCLDCGLVKKIHWKLGMPCPMCGSERFFPVVYVEDLDKATGKSKKTLMERSERKIKVWEKQVKLRYKYWLVWLLLAVNIGLWGRYLILNVDIFKGNVKFEWPHFYQCKECRQYFSRTMQDDVGRIRCPKCRAIKIRRIKNLRVAR